MLVLTYSSLFNREYLSDITIESYGRHFKCHKVVLSAAPPPLTKLFQLDKVSDDGRAPVVVLPYDDQWDGIDAMLRFIYGFEYQEIVHKSMRGEPFPPVYHLRVYTAARKYEMPKLADSAIMALDQELATMKSRAMSARRPEDFADPELVSALAEYLAEFWDDSSSFVEKSNELIQVYLPALMRLPEFREWLMRKNNPALQCLFAAVDSTLTQEHTLQICQHCNSTWADRPQVEHRCKDGWQMVNSEVCKTTRFSYLAGRMRDVVTEEP